MNDFTMPDGTPITIGRDTDGTPIVVHVEGQDFNATLDDSGMLGFEGFRISLDGAALADVLRLRAVLNAGVVEALVTAANAQLGAKLPESISPQLRLGVRIGAAFERNQGRLHITQDQVYDLAIIAAEVVSRELMA